MPAVTVWGLWVPATFWDDHADRCPSDDGDAGLMREDKRRGRRVRVTGSARQLECLRSDAAFYCGADGPDECPPAIKRSAKRTLEVIQQARAENPALHEELKREARRGELAEMSPALIARLRGGA